VSSGVDYCLTLILILQKKRRVLFGSDEEEAERLAIELVGGVGLEVSNPVEGGELGERVAPSAETQDVQKSWNPSLIFVPVWR